MGICYVPYKEIDQQRWDQCIAHASNERIYGYSIYLNAMAAHWDALVLDDYDAVMPLTWNKKYGVHYLYQPFFTACLGVFGRSMSASMVEAFLKAIPRKFRYWDLSLNHGNYFSLHTFNLYQRSNFILPLQEHYETLYNRFRTNIKRNIKKAADLGCTLQTMVDARAVITLNSEQFGHIIPPDAYNRFYKLYQQLEEKKQATAYGIFTPDQQLVAAALFFFSGKRAYYILAGNHPNGRTIGASHALIDAFIKDHAEKDLLLDFEGSDLRNLAFFYSSFGAVEEKYAGLKVNRLPPLLRLFKR